MPLSELAKKNYPKTMLSEYHKAMFYDNTGEPAKAQKAFMSAFGLTPIRDLTKDMMLERADAIKGQLKKGKERSPGWCAHLRVIPRGNFVHQC